MSAAPNVKRKEREQDSAIDERTFDLDQSGTVKDADSNAKLLTSEYLAELFKFGHPMISPVLRQLSNSALSNCKSGYENFGAFARATHESTSCTVDLGFQAAMEAVDRLTSIALRGPFHLSRIQEDRKELANTIEQMLKESISYSDAVLGTKSFAEVPQATIAFAAALASIGSSNLTTMTQKWLDHSSQMFEPWFGKK